MRRVAITVTVCLAVGCGNGATDPDGGGADAGGEGDAGGSTVVGAYAGEVHFQVANLDDPDEPDVGGFYESPIEIASRGTDLEVTFVVLNVALELTPPGCTLAATQIDGALSLVADQPCEVAVGNFEGTWTFASGVIEVSLAGDLAGSAIAVLEEAGGARSSWSYTLLGQRE
jgi:hypothetical protein